MSFWSLASKAVFLKTMLESILATKANLTRVYQNYMLGITAENDPRGILG